jgi:hypothetical protein
LNFIDDDAGKYTGTGRDAEKEKNARKHVRDRYPVIEIAPSHFTVAEPHPRSKTARDNPILWWIVFQSTERLRMDI